MEYAEFDSVVREVYSELPEVFRSTIDNVHIVVEDVPDERHRLRGGTARGSLLLGLYQGVPLTKRDTGYGMVPTVPDVITMFKKNIESVCSNDTEVRALIRDVLIHEIGHYYGMSEAQIRKAGY
jgi:predicted Zn-dependent protease with MMP-like domain